MDCWSRMLTSSTAFGEMSMPIPTPAQVLGGDADGSAAAERVQHDVVLVAPSTDDAHVEVTRLLMVHVVVPSCASPEGNMALDLSQKIGAFKLTFRKNC